MNAFYSPVRHGAGNRSGVEPLPVPVAIQTALGILSALEARHPQV